MTLFFALAARPERVQTVLSLSSVGSHDARGDQPVGTGQLVAFRYVITAEDGGPRSAVR